MEALPSQLCVEKSGHGIDCRSRRSIMRRRTLAFLITYTDKCRMAHRCEGQATISAATAFPPPTGRRVVDARPDGILLIRWIQTSPGQAAMQALRSASICA